jgi:hypothetical protein
MARESRIVIVDDSYNRPGDGPHMPFRLTYDGPLYARQHNPVREQSDKRKEHKHDLRKRFYQQLKRLWEITPFLRAPIKTLSVPRESVCHENGLLSAFGHAASAVGSRAT